MDGGYMRAWDFEKWEPWASDADLGWGAWSIESGWTQSWITITLGLKLLNTSLWEVGQSIDDIEHDFDEWIGVFFPPPSPPPPPPPPLPCINRTVAGAAAVQYNLTTTDSGLCAGSNAVSVLYTGTVCTKLVRSKSKCEVGSILWTAMHTLDPRPGEPPSKCTWSRTADPKDVPAYFGYWGIAPTAVRIPVAVCE